MSATDQRSPFVKITRSQAAASITHEDEGSQKSVHADLPSTATSDMSTEPVELQLDAQPSSMTSSNPPAASAEHQPPPSPVMDLETDLPPGEILWNINWDLRRNRLRTCRSKVLLCVSAESLGQKKRPPQRGVKRPRDSVYSRKRVWIYVIMFILSALDLAFSWGDMFS